MEAFTLRLEEEVGSVVSGSGSNMADHPTSESIESSSNQNFLDEISSTEAPIMSTGVSAQKLALYEGPEIIQRLNVFEEVELGGVVAFECQCKGHPTPGSKWYKDDVELVVSERLAIEDSVETDGKLRLVINNARKSDEGAYRCKMENQEGVAATTGYLSVTGTSSSPKSDHAISTAPLLRAITEESNASQDLDEETFTPLEKILTGEYDLTTLPYSQYLELMKESNARSNEPGSSNGENEKSVENRTPAWNTQNVVVTENGRSDSQSSDAGVVMETDQTPTVEKMAAIESETRFENDFELSVSTDSTNSLESEDPIKRVSTYGLNVEHVQIFQENLGDRLFEKVDVSDTEILQENIVVEDVDDKFGEVYDDNEMDEKKFEETVIAGRIGLPSDWEFAHYTSEMDDNEEILIKENLPDEFGYQVETEPISQMVLETTGFIPQNEIVSDLETLDAAQINLPCEKVFVDQTSLLPVPGDTTSDEDSVRNNLLVEQSVVRDSSEVSDLPENLKDKQDLHPEVLEDSSKAVHERGETESSAKVDLQPEPETSPKVNLEEISEALPESNPEHATLEVSSIGGGEGDKQVLTINHQEEVPRVTVESYQFAGEDEHLNEVIPEVNGYDTTVLPPEVAPVESFLVNRSAESTIPDKATKYEILPSFEVLSGDGINQTTKPVESMFMNFVPDLSPTVTAISEWIPEVSSISKYLPNLAAQSQWEMTPASLEEIDVSIIPDQSLVDWCVEWFQYPWFFYVLLVLLSTIFASATQSNPALVILVVAMVSLVGFFIFPLQGVKNK